MNYGETSLWQVNRPKGEQISHKDRCCDVPPARSSVTHPIFCGQDYLDIQDRVPFSSTMNKQCLIKIFLSHLFIGHILFNKSAEICRSRDYRQINMGKQREMVRGVTFFPLRLNNFRFLNPDRRGDKNIVKFEPEK